MQELQQTIDQITNHIKGIWIKKRYVMIASWLICPIGMAYVLMMPDKYVSDTSVYVDTRSALQPMLKGLAVTSNPQEEVSVIARTLFSRNNLEKIIRETDLDIQAKDADEYEEILLNLEQNLTLKSRGGKRTDRVYTISYSHQDPAMSQRVVQETLDLFIEGTLGETRVDSDSATKFIDSQIEEYEQRLIQSEERLANFKRKYNDILPQQGSFYNYLSELKAQKEQVELSIDEVTGQLDKLKSNISRANTAIGNANEGLQESSRVISTEYDARIQSLETLLDQLRLRYTDKHPEVKESIKLLASLKEQREAEIKKYMQSLSPTSPAINSNSPVLQEMALEINRLEGELASLEIRRDSVAKKITEIEERIDLIPIIEAELTGLNRDYGITKSKYEQLLNRRESAIISKSAELQSDDIQFRVISPPKLPNKPAGPKRILFYTVVLFAGFGAGIGLAFLVNQLSPIVLTSGQLSNAVGIPVFGIVSHVNVDMMRKKNRWRFITFLVSSGLVVCLYLGLVVADIASINLSQYVEYYLR